MGMVNCKFLNRRSGKLWEGSIQAYWEVSLDPISDDYTPNEINAYELFEQWIEAVNVKHPDGLIPVLWFVKFKGKDVDGNDVDTSESMPFQFEHPGVLSQNFLTYFTQPVHPITEKPLNWFNLPVVDKMWSPKRFNKGGFIQQATGWKPSVLQPYIYLPTLTSILSQQY
jgi:hypothetical protein